MPENNGAPGTSEWIQVGDVSGTMIVGNQNTVTVHTGPPPTPIKRQPISQLPRSVADPLIGREQDLGVLQQAVETRQLVQIFGASGVGKSALLRHLACMIPRGLDGVAYIEAGGRTADDLAQAIFDISFDAPNYKPSLEVLKEHLKTLRLRIYLDDAGLDQKDLHRLFDMAERSAFVFTSQQRSAVAGVHAVQLHGLTAQAGANLVRAVLARGLQPDEARTVAALSDAVSGNPLRLRRIALSAATGKGLPGIAELPALLPALLNRLRPPERDLLHLLGSLSGAELAARQLNALLGRSDTDALADGLVRHGLLLASETGYGCPPDVAGCVLKSRMTEFPADRLCRALTAWIEARDTTPDEVAAHFLALDVAVLRAEKSGQAQLGVTLARAASPKLALSRQFDAWGSLLGAGWTAAKSAGDSVGEEFFLSEARTRRRAIGRAAQTTALVLEAEVLWHELAALQAHSAAHQVANAAAATTAPPVHTVVPTHAAGHTPTVTHTASHAPAFTHPAAFVSGPPAPVHPPVPRQVINLSQHTQQPAATTTHVTSAHSAAQTPPRIDLSQAHTTTAAQSTHTVSATTSTTASGTGHTALTVAGAAGAKGVSALAIACVLGLAAVVGVGATVYANNQSSPPPLTPVRPVIAPSFTIAPDPITPGPDPATSQNDDPSPVPTPDPVCATVLPALSPEIDQFNTDFDALNAAVTSYNQAIDSYNSNQTSTAPDKSTVLADTSAVINDLSSRAATLRDALSQATDSSVVTDLNGILTPIQQEQQQFESFRDGSQSSYDNSSQAAASNSAHSHLVLDCL